MIPGIHREWWVIYRRLRLARPLNRGRDGVVRGIHARRNW